MPKPVSLREVMMRHRLHVGRLLEALEKHPTMPPKRRAHLISLARQLQGGLYDAESEPTKDLPSVAA